MPTILRSGQFSAVRGEACSRTYTCENVDEQLRVIGKLNLLSKYGFLMCRTDPWVMIVKAFEACSAVCEVECCEIARCIRNCLMERRLSCCFELK
jgi:hypothetical protein